jgi:hypothetical protein
MSNDQNGGTKTSGAKLEKTMGNAPSSYGNPVTKVSIPFKMSKSK